jgi:hypothetical protein
MRCLEFVLCPAHLLWIDDIKIGPIAKGFSMRYAKWMLPVTTIAAILLGLPALTARAADEAKKGTITGSVLNKEGKGVSGAEVSVFKAAATKPAPKGEAKGAVKNQAEDPKAPKEGKKAKAEALFKSKTDAEGKFTIRDVPAGDYRVIATEGAKLQGAEKVTVTDAVATVTINLKEKKAKKAAK